MKLVQKIVLFSILTLAIAIITFAVFMDLRMRSVIENDIQNRALVLVRTFES